MRTIQEFHIYLQFTNQKLFEATKVLAPREFMLGNLKYGQDDSIKSLLYSY